jgi:hypothetical protein
MLLCEGTDASVSECDSYKDVVFARCEDLGILLQGVPWVGGVWDIPILEFTYVLNAGTLHDGTQFSDFSIFAPPHPFFGILTKLESMTLM